MVQVIIAEGEDKLYERTTDFGSQYSVSDNFLYYFEINSLQRSIILQNGMQLPFEAIEEISIQKQYDGFNIQIIKRGYDHVAIRIGC